MKLQISAAMFVAAAAFGCQRQATGDTTPKLPEPASEGVIASIEERLARLEVAYTKNAEALDFLAKIYAQQKLAQEAQDREDPAEDAMFAVNIADGVQAGQVDGPPDAAVTIIKVFDFACPYCAQTAAMLEDLVKDYKGKVRVVYMNLVIHPSARPAHLASCAAARQGKYNQFKHAFWDKGFAPYAKSHDTSKLGEANIVAIAKGVGLDVAKLKTDMASPACAERLERDMTELAKFHVNATPTFFINGKQLGGALAKEGFQQVVDEQLKIAEASGVAGGEYYDKVVFAKGEKQFRSKLDPKPGK